MGRGEGESGVGGWGADVSSLLCQPRSHRAPKKDTGEVGERGGDARPSPGWARSAAPARNTAPPIPLLALGPVRAGSYGTGLASSRTRRRPLWYTPGHRRPRQSRSTRSPHPCHRSTSHARRPRRRAWGPPGENTLVCPGPVLPSWGQDFPGALELRTQRPALLLGQGTSPSTSQPGPQQGQPWGEGPETPVPPWLCGPITQPSASSAVTWPS